MLFFASHFTSPSTLPNLPFSSSLLFHPFPYPSPQVLGTLPRSISQCFMLEFFLVFILLVGTPCLCWNKKGNTISQLKIPNYYKQHLGVINNLLCSRISQINKWPDSEFLNFYFWRKKWKNAMTYILKNGHSACSLCEYTTVCTHNDQFVFTNQAQSVYTLIATSP